MRSRRGTAHRVRRGLALTLLAVGCTGEIQTSGMLPAGGASSVGARPGASPPSNGTGSSPAAAPASSSSSTTPVMRRLNGFEYDNTVRELLGDASRPSRAFPADERRAGFDNDAASLGFSAVFAEQALAAAEALARGPVRQNLARWAPCAAAQTTEACAREFVAAFGARAWRRPLQADEIDRLIAVHRTGAAQEGFARGLEMAATTILVSLPFLYRVEVGDGAPIAGKPGLMRLTSYEMASRLSYFLWAGPPDDALFVAAREDRLRDPAQIAREAERMLGAKADARVRAMTAHFHAAWLRLDGIASANKDPMKFRGYTAAFPELLRQETEQFLDATAWDGGGLPELLTARHSFMNRALASYYGATGATGDAFVRVQLDPQRRAGLLTQGGFLALEAGFDRSSVVRRGVFVRDRLLCDVLPPPPGDVDVTLAPVTSTATNREIVLAHSRDPSCWGCHELIDPIGVGFERYDASGAYRDAESGRPIDDSGEVVRSPIGKFTGAVELATRLATADEVTRCFARMWLTYALGRELGAADAPALERVSAARGDYRATVLAVIQSDGFLYLGSGGGR